MHNTRVPPAPCTTYVLADNKHELLVCPPNWITARWEKRYNQQVSATETALLEKRNANISLREAERVLEKERAAAAKAVQEATTAAAEAAEAMRDIAAAQDERNGGLKKALRSDSRITTVRKTLYQLTYWCKG